MALPVINYYSWEPNNLYDEIILFANLDSLNNTYLDELDSTLPDKINLLRKTFVAGGVSVNEARAALMKLKI